MAEEDICKISKCSTSHRLELALMCALLMLMWLQLKSAVFRKLSYLLARTWFVQRYFLFEPKKLQQIATHCALWIFCECVLNTNKTQNLWTKSYSVVPNAVTECPQQRKMQFPTRKTQCLETWAKTWGLSLPFGSPKHTPLLALWVLEKQVSKCGGLLWKLHQWDSGCVLMVDNKINAFSDWHMKFSGNAHHVPAAWSLCLWDFPWMLLIATIRVAMRCQTKRQSQFCLLKKTRICHLHTSSLTLRTPGYRASFVPKADLA